MSRVDLMEVIAAVAFGYLAGSLPFAFLLARRRGVDLRVSGSGNIGGANVFRTSGATSAALAILLDAAKGAIAVVVMRQLTSGPATPVVAGLAAVVGHVYPVWLKFRGGKGVATSAGVFLVFEPLAVTIAAGVFTLGVLSTRYVSVGSMAGAVTLAASVLILGSPTAVVVGALVAALVVVHGHRGNLGRLVAGTERRVFDRS